MLNEFIGESPAVCNLRRLLPELSGGLTPLVITGKPGVGKHLYASHIHLFGPRSDLPSISMNFRLLSDRAQRLALFGGGPPELSVNRRSILESPTTVILKHLNESDLYIQRSLYEALARGTITRAAPGEHPVRARIIFTFREPCPVLMREGQLGGQLAEMLVSFRHITIPPIDKRREDVSLIALYYMNKFRSTYKDAAIRGLGMDGIIDAELLYALSGHTWKENVRDIIGFLYDLIELPVIEKLKRPEVLEFSKMMMMADTGEEFSLPESLSMIERTIVQRTLHKYAGRQEKTSAMLGMTGRSVRRKILQNG